MKKVVLSMHLLLLTAMTTFAQNSPPLLINGRLKLVGNQLSNQCGSPVQLRGMSTHAMETYKVCLDQFSIQSLAVDWKADLIRLAVYTEDIGTGNGTTTPGYYADSVNWNNYIYNIVNLAEKAGIYVIVDWHVLSDQTPMKHIDQAQKFFASMARNLANKRNVIYEICNEPNSGTSWSTIKSYANTIIPIIRKYDSEGIILVGTPEWSSKPTQAAADKLTGNNAYNVMYTFHFYAASHYADYQTELKNAASQIPIFVSEWGTTSASGDGGYDAGNSDTWLGILNSLKISWANWAFVDKGETSSALTTGSCASAAWTSRTTSGNYVYGKMSVGDAFTQCAAAADDDKDGVPNGDDNCANTPIGTTVDARGCPTLQGDTDKDGVIDANDICANTPSGTKVNAWGCPMDLPYKSNVCMGFNNFQGYARTDFSVDSLANMEYWDRPREKSPVYSATTSGGKLIVKVTNGDPNYKTFGFSFGEKIVPNGNTFDTTLIPLDIRHYSVVKFSAMLTPASSYTTTDALIDVQLEDASGKSISCSSLNKLFRLTYKPMSTVVNFTCDFTGGSLESYDATVCGTGVKTPCYVNKDFDFSRVTKVKMWVNPGAGATWSRPAFNGTLTIDDFSIGYDATTAPKCDPTRDDDNDGVVQESDKCPDTPPGATVDANGCAQSQLDTDKDGVPNSNDNCPNTPKGIAVDINGCPLSTGISEDMRSGRLAIYPIPASQNLTIDQKGTDFTKAVIMDITGNVMREASLQGSKETLSLEGLAKGIYLLQLSSAGKSELLRLIVQ
jgi:aryl-phospho-beta-D-glucosidase BglC (GH1 family)